MTFFCFDLVRDDLVTQKMLWVRIFGVSERFLMRMRSLLVHVRSFFV